MLQLRLYEASETLWGKANKLKDNLLDLVAELVDQETLAKVQAEIAEKVDLSASATARKELYERTCVEIVGPLMEERLFDQSSTREPAEDRDAE